MKKFSKLFKTIISISLALVFIFSVGCAQEEDPGAGSNTPTIVPGTPTQKIITLDKESVELKVGQSSTILVLSKDKESISPIVWRSENEAIAKIDQQGTVQAMGEGTTDIVVSQGSLTAKCKIISSFMGETAQVSLPVGDEVTVQPNKGLKLNPTILFDDKTFDDGVFTYSVSETGFTVENGVVKGTESGTSAYVVIKGTWRGQTAVTKQLKVNVVDGVNVLVKEYAIGSTIDTIYNVSGNPTVLDFTPVVYVNDVIKTDAVVSVVVNNSNMEYNPGNHKLTVKGYGITLVTITYNHNDSNIVKTYTFDIAIPDGYAKITLDVGENVSGVVTGLPWISKAFMQGQTVELPVPYVFGYEFKGWKNVDTQEIIAVSGGKCIITSFSGEETVLEAIWERIDSVVSGPVIPL